MSRNLKNNFYTFVDSTEIKDILSDTTLAHNSNVNTLQNNEYNVAYGTNITTFKSDGTKKVGLELLINDVQMLDEIIVEVQARSIEGVNPTLYILQTNANGDINKGATTTTKCTRADFEFLQIEQVYSDYFSSKMVKVFIGLNVGESGTFSIRDFVINHKSSRKYTYNSTNIKKQKKVFKISKNNDIWSCESGGSFLSLDSGIVTIPYISQMQLVYDKAFLGASPILTITLNNSFNAYTVRYIKNNRDLLTLYLTNADGTNASWNTLPNGSQIIIQAETNLYW